MSGIVLNGRLISAAPLALLGLQTKSADALSHFIRAAGAVADGDELDALTDAFAQACGDGDVSRVEAELGVRALGRALTRLEAGGDGAAGGRED